VAYQSPFDDAVAAPFHDELKTVQTGSKTSDTAWASAVSKAKAIAKRQGVQ
jgi:cellobiose transport system substrate-binding protein